MIVWTATPVKEQPSLFDLGLLIALGAFRLVIMWLPFAATIGFIILGVVALVALFEKNQDICNITIYYNKVIDGATPVTTQTFPNTVFIFDIVGVPKDDTLNGSRIFLK